MNLQEINHVTHKTKGFLLGSLLTSAIPQIGELFTDKHETYNEYLSNSSGISFWLIMVILSMNAYEVLMNAQKEWEHKRKNIS